MMTPPIDVVSVGHSDSIRTASSTCGFLVVIVLVRMTKAEHSCSFKRHRFPPEIIAYAVWAYYRFAMSLRDVEDVLAERGVIVSHETIRKWVQKFGPKYAKAIRRDRPSPSDKWHLDEVVIPIRGVNIGCGAPWIAVGMCLTFLFSHGVTHGPLTSFSEIHSSSLANRVS